MSPNNLCCCGHNREEHCLEKSIDIYSESKRELCLRCPGYEEPGYPNGWAWHRFRGYEDS